MPFTAWKHTERNRQTDRKKYVMMRFHGSCSTEKLFKWQYIVFFRAYLDTIQKALIRICWLMHQIGYLVEYPIIPHFSNTKLPRFTRLWLSAFFYAPHINSVNRGMPVLWNYQFFSVLLTNMIQFNLFATGRFQKLEQNLNPMTAFREQFKMGQKIAAELAKLAVLFGW